MEWRLYSRAVVLSCLWSRTGEESDVPLDILIYYADVPCANSKFDEIVKTSAIILQTLPSTAPFAQLKQIHSKIFFEMPEGQPEMYMDFDFESKSGGRERAPRIERGPCFPCLGLTRIKPTYAAIRMPTGYPFTAPATASKSL